MSIDRTLTGACTMMVVEQTQGCRISFELTKPNQSNQAFCWYHDADNQLTLSTQAFIQSLGVTSSVA